MIQLIDRPWVDYSGAYGGLFEPFNTSQWEIDSVRYSVSRVIREERKAEAKAARLVTLANETGSVGEGFTATGEPMAEPISTMMLHRKTMDALQRSWFSLLEIVALPRYVYIYARVMIAAQKAEVAEAQTKQRTQKKQDRGRRELVEGKPLWFGLRSQYDLNPYGFDITVRLWPMDE